MCNNRRASQSIPHVLACNDYGRRKSKDKMKGRLGTSNKETKIKEETQESQPPARSAQNKSRRIDESLRQQPRRVREMWPLHGVRVGTGAEGKEGGMGNE